MQLQTMSEMLLFVLSVASLLCRSAGRPSVNYLENHFETEEVRSEAIKRLLEVFGMEDPPHARGHKQAPQYMLDLYNTVADVDGVTKDPYLLEGNTVRSFFDKCKFHGQCKWSIRCSCCISSFNCRMTCTGKYSYTLVDVFLMWFVVFFSDSAQWTRIQVQSVQRGQNREGPDCWAASFQVAPSVNRCIQQTSFLPGKHFMDQKRRQITNNNTDPIARRGEIFISTQSIFLFSSRSGQRLSGAWYHEKEHHAGQKAAVLSTHPHPLKRLGSVHHHPSCKCALP